jgi:hypothetical protein
MSRICAVVVGVGSAPTTLVSSRTSRYEPKLQKASTTTVAMTLIATIHGLC